MCQYTVQASSSSVCTQQLLTNSYHLGCACSLSHRDIIKAVIARASALLGMSEPTLQQRGALAGLLHLLLLLLNCIPGTRHLLVEADLHSKLVAMVCSFPATASATASSDGSTAQQPWPAYLACALLLLDLLAQPLVKQDKPDPATAAAAAAAELAAGSSDEGVEESKSSEPTDSATAATASSGTEAAATGAAGSSSASDATAQAAAATGSDSMDTDSPEVPATEPSATSDATASGATATTDSAAAAAEGKENAAAKPAAAAAEPVRPPELASELTSEQALALTAHIAEMLKAVAGSAPVLRPPSPALTHALLHLLARLLRSADCAAAFVAAGGAPALLALPTAAAFEGRVALIAVILRHLLEDPVTLQAAMETEIRSSYQRMLRASREGRSAGFGLHSVPVGNGRRESVVRLLPLLNLLTPLIARDRDVFMRAAAATLVVHDVTSVAGAGAGRSHVALRPAGQHAAAATAAGGAATAALPPVTPRAASGASHDAMDEVTDSSATAAEPGSSSTSITAAAAVPTAATAAATGSKSTGKGKGKARDKHHHGHHDGVAAAAGAGVRDTVMGLLLTALLTPPAAAVTAAPATAAVVPAEQWLSSENLLVCLTKSIITFTLSCYR
jgi:hypothetical protein